jgi:hypothetical protein
MKPHLCIGTLLLAGSTLAQGQIVVPNHFGPAAGPGNRFAPFNLQNHWLGIYDELMPAGGLIRGIAFRRESFTANYRAFTVTLDAWASTAATNSTTPSTTFATNHGTDLLRVVTARLYNMPAAPNASVPGEFLYDLPFDVPFMHGGAGPLAVETLVSANTIPAFNNPAFDYAAGSDQSPLLAVASYGAGCIGTGSPNALAAAGSSTTIWQSGVGTLIVNGTNGLANSFVMTLVGFSDTDLFGVPLPVLIPGTTSCFVRTSISFGVVATTDGAGASSTQIQVPCTPDLHGLRSFSQNWSFDAAANAAGIVTSNGVQHNWVAPYISVPAAIVFQSTAAATPTATAGAGYVIRCQL